MTTSKRIILLLVGIGIAAALFLRQSREAAVEAPRVEQANAARLVELGSTTCKSCKAMHEELARLREECGSSVVVEEIDVWRDEGAAKKFGVSVIPTQVFLDAGGREVDRHVGFLARADIRERFTKHGVECQP